MFQNALKARRHRWCVGTLSLSFHYTVKNQSCEKRSRARKNPWHCRCQALVHHFLPLVHFHREVSGPFASRDGTWNTYTHLRACTATLLMNKCAQRGGSFRLFSFRLTFVTGEQLKERNEKKEWKVFIHPVVSISSRVDSLTKKKKKDRAHQVSTVAFNTLLNTLLYKQVFVSLPAGTLSLSVSGTGIVGTVFIRSHGSLKRCSHGHVFCSLRVVECWTCSERRVAMDYLWKGVCLPQWYRSRHPR